MNIDEEYLFLLFFFKYKSLTRETKKGGECRGHMLIFC